MDDPENGAVFSNLYVAAGLQEGEHQGTFWSDGDCYKWMEAATHVYSVTHEAELDLALDELIEVVSKAQDSDGYICTQIQLTDKERWQATRHHELYNMGHLLTAACVHHRATGKKSFLLVAVKLADYLYRMFSPKPLELANFGWNPSNIMGLVDLYRETSDGRYLELADIFVTMRGSSPRGLAWTDTGSPTGEAGTDQNQDRVSFRDESKAVGHAVTATYLYAGGTDVFAETGDLPLFDGLQRVWRNVVDRKMYITGAVGAHHAAVSQRGDKVWETFGLDYQLPSATAYNESCANIGNAMWNRRMLEVTGDCGYADVLERVIYNSGLSPISIDGTHFCYTNPLRWYGDEHNPLSHDTPERWEIHDCYCCPPQVARMIAWMQNWAYGISGNQLWVHLFGSSKLETKLAEGAQLSVSQHTEYPWAGKITLIVDKAPEGMFTLRIRIPGWAQGATLAVAGEQLGPEPGTYAAVERTWSDGDTVELYLRMEPALMISNPKVEETSNLTAIVCGPLVYCLESIDLPEDATMDEVAIPQDIQLQPEYDSSLLGGVVKLKGDALRIEQPKDTLYGVLPRDRNQKAGKIPITMIPYFGWNNRGATHMSVWLPLVRASMSEGS